MFNILRTSTEHKTASLADEGNSAYFQSSGAHNIKHINLWKLTLRGDLNTDVQAGLELGIFRSRERCLTARPHNYSLTTAKSLCYESILVGALWIWEIETIVVQMFLILPVLLLSLKFIYWLTEIKNIRKKSILWPNYVSLD